MAAHSAPILTASKPARYTCAGNWSGHFGAVCLGDCSCSAMPSSRPPVLTQRILCATAVCCAVERGSSPARPAAGASSERPVIKSMVNALK